MNLSKLFYQFSKNHHSGLAQLAPEDSKDWPDAWHTTFYKTYEKLPRIPLPKSPLPAILLETALAERASARSFAKNPITLEELGVLLQHACGETTIFDISRNRKRRAYPSGGGRFPTEVYVCVFQATPGLTPGLYHYDVAGHTLELIRPHTMTAEEIGQLFTYTWVQNAALAIVLTAVGRRTLDKYGDRGYRYLLMEA